MKKRLILFLIMFMILGTGTGFANQDPQEALELDPRVKALRTGDFYPGDVKFLSDGNLAICKDGLSYRGTTIEKLNWAGDPIATTPPEWSEGWYWDDFVYGFVVEDADGNLFTSVGLRVWKFTPDFSKTTPVMDLQPDWNDVKSKDRVMINLIREDAEGSDTKFAALTYPEGKEPINPDTQSFYQMSEWEDDQILSLLGIQSGKVISADFGDRSDEVYLLVSESTEIGDSWYVCPVTMAFAGTSDGDGSLELKIDQTKEKIELGEMPDSQTIMTMEFDGDNFHIAATNMHGGGSTIIRYGRNGEKKDTIQLPRYVLKYDAKGKKSVVAINSLNGSEINGFYKIEWESESVGSPRSLIHERSIGGKTLATFRDGGYGLLRSEEPETGLTDYLAPLKTKEQDVRLRIPLCDVMAKVEENARNLEILYGEERIVIPMSALTVQNLLAQMPCETDATIEIHLERGEDGFVIVTAELFVVEQVDDMTKVVHRAPIVLP